LLFSDDKNRNNSNVISTQLQKEKKKKRGEVVTLQGGSLRGKTFYPLGVKERCTGIPMPFSSRLHAHLTQNTFNQGFSLRGSLQWGIPISGYGFLLLSEVIHLYSTIKPFTEPK
jgi:hypothetical protein